MSNLANSYPIFEENQVLTSSQLNDLVTYLDEQSRLTRVKLIGMGVACGLVPIFIPPADPSTDIASLKITGGTGITSEGYLIKLGDCTVTKYRPYSLPNGVTYAPFGVPMHAGLDLYEILTADAEEDPSNPSTPITQSFLEGDNKIVMLFLECYDNDLASCLSKSCDELGMKRTFTLRKLVVSEQDLLDFISPTPEDAAEYLFPGKYDLPEVIMPRVIFDPAQPHSSQYQQFSSNYINALRNTFNDMFNTALPETYNVFKPILGPLYEDTNPLANVPGVGTWNSYLNGLPVGSGPMYLGMQYFYDFVKDLILAYNEFRDTAFELMSKCCPNMAMFPKHLMLGEAITPDECRPSEYRHHFLEALVTREQKYLLEKTLTLHKRMVLMTQKFDIDTINNPNPVVTFPATLGEPLLVTPSDDKRVPLSDRAIPYYYRNNEGDSSGYDLGTLGKNWSYEYLRKCLEDKGIVPLSYNNQDPAQPSPGDRIRTPLRFDTDRFSFLRIEGHLRQNYVNVQKELERLKLAFNIPFKVVALRLQGPEPDEIRSRCNFDDLRTQYLAVREEVFCTFKPIFDRFATKTSSGVALKDLPLFFTELVSDCDNNRQYVGSITDFNNAWQTYQGTTSVGIVSDIGVGGDPTARAAGPTAPVAVGPFLTRSNLKMSVVQGLVEDALYELCLRLDMLMNTQSTNPPITLLPFDLADFNYGATEATSNKSFIKTYAAAMQFAIDAKIWLNHLLDQIIRSQKNRNTPELYFVLSQYMAEVFGQLDKVISSCFYKKLELIYYMLEYRVNYVKSNDQTLFSNFIRKHPGAEHHAGVWKGGTFIIVYNGNNLSLDRPRRTAVIQMLRDAEVAELETAALSAQSARTVSQDNQIAANNAFVANVSLLVAELADPFIPPVRIDIDKDQVIADFALPYLCCDDGECSDIPAPTAVQDLKLPAVAIPVYVEYRLGDYAFAKDIDVSTQGCETPREIVIDIIARLQLENSFSPSDIRIELVENDSAKHYTDPDIFNFRENSTTIVSGIQTFNTPNQPRSSVPVKRGDARVILNNTEGKQYISYTPATGFVGVDSFYYIFEVIDDAKRVIRRSSMGKVTVVATNRCVLPTVPVGNNSAVPVNNNPSA
jgi:hypothetical protein